MQPRDLGLDVVVEDFHYGAVAVAQRIEELAPQRLLFVGAEQRGRPPGTVERRRLKHPPAGNPQGAVEEAVVGYVSIDIAVLVASGLGALPEATVTIEGEPATIEPSEQLSPTGERMLEEIVQLAETEARRAPLLNLVDEIRRTAAGTRLAESPALDALLELLGELDLLDEHGRWGRSFTLRDRLRMAIAQGDTSEGMDHMDWGLWWALIEELDRLEKVEGASEEL